MAQPLEIYDQQNPSVLGPNLTHRGIYGKGVGWRWIALRLWLMLDGSWRWVELPTVSFYFASWSFDSRWHARLILSSVRMLLSGGFVMTQRGAEFGQSACQDAILLLFRSCHPAFNCGYTSFYSMLFEHRVDCLTVSCRNLIVEFGPPSCYALAWTKIRLLSLRPLTESYPLRVTMCWRSCAALSLWWSCYVDPGYLCPIYRRDLV